MNDVDEVLQNILVILHQSFTSCPAPDASSESEKSKRVECQQWTSNKCLAHRLFGMDIYGYCDSCGLEWRHQTFSDFSHYIRSSQLREKKAVFAIFSLYFDSEVVFLYFFIPYYNIYQNNFYPVSICVINQPLCNRTKIKLAPLMNL
jgi:hypothetical protein